ncbi:MAG TPA: hypothetical protein DEQ02_04890 [Ruminococcaceae bacterium]|nr:hypothetical protein [Oscillospiraceae bacterium]
MKYKVLPIVCDYGVYCYDDNDGEVDLVWICNSRKNSLMIADILAADENHRVYDFNSTSPEDGGENTELTF